MSDYDTTLSNLGIGRTGAAAAQTVQSAAQSQSLGQADFLKLMTAQMENQDPFNPVDNTQMVAQMAQFSQLSGINDMSTTLKAISDKLGGSSTSDALAYVGKTVLVPGDTAYGRTGGGIAGAVELKGPVSDLAVTISDANGGVLKTMPLGAVTKAGTVEFDWDGKTDAGEDAGTGPFKVSVRAQNGGTSVGSQALVWAPVESVNMTGPTPTLTLPGLGQVATTDVRKAG